MTKEKILKGIYGNIYLLLYVVYLILLYLKIYMHWRHQFVAPRLQATIIVGRSGLVGSVRTVDRQRLWLAKFNLISRLAEAGACSR